MARARAVRAAPRLARRGVRAAPTAWRSACSPSAGRASAAAGSTALIVDHGLRPESGAEAPTVACLARAARHPTITFCVWHGPKPATGIQAAAREARYALLGDWCRAAGVLHLLLGHHRDDQAETVALRAARRSGPDGLAGMAAVREIAGLRLLRPLLAVPKARLLRDPARRRPGRGSRTRATSRRASPAARLRHRRRPTCRRSLAERQRRRRADARPAHRRLARRLCPHRSGRFRDLAATALAEAPPEIARRALQQAAAGGRRWRLSAARRPARSSARGAARAGRHGRTLAGCRILPWGERAADLPRGRGDRAAAAARPAPGSSGTGALRFVGRAQAAPSAAPTVRALGAGRRRAARRLALARRCAAAGRPCGLASRMARRRLVAVAGLGAIRAAQRRAALPAAPRRLRAPCRRTAAGA